MNWSYKDDIDNNGISTECLNLLKSKVQSKKEYLECKAYLYELQANIGKYKMNFLGYILTFIFNRMYSKINVMIDNIHGLKALQKESPIIYVPCHKSHFDYLLIQFTIITLQLGTPFIAAGENLNLTGIGSLLRGGGAFFIKRSFTIPIHKLVTSAYISVLLKRNHCIEFFIEGTRSRTGKLKKSKFGLLKMIVSGMPKDAFIVPISITYDRVAETQSYVTELLGSEKEQESILSLIKGVSVINEKYGNINIRFGEPFSINNYLKNNQIQTLGYEILYRINDLAVISPSALLATALLTHTGKGVGKVELIKRIDWIKERVLDRDGFLEMSNSLEIINDSLNILKPTLVKEKYGLLEQVFYTDKRYELSYYRNQLIHLFVNEALVCAVLHSNKHKDMPTNELLQEVRWLSKMLKFEFIFRSKPIKSNLMDTLDRLQKDEIIDSFNDQIVTFKKVIGAPREKFDFYCFLVFPFIESYWLASVSLFSLYWYLKDIITENKTCSPGKFMQATTNIGYTLHYQGDLFFMESINKDNILNAWEYLQLMLPLTFDKDNIKIELGVVEFEEQVDLKDPIAADFPKGLLKDMIYHINKFRMKPHTTMWRVIRCCEIAKNEMNANSKL